MFESPAGPHGCKEGLVAWLRNWPGIHSVRALLDGEPIRGLWFDRTKEYAARNRGEDADSDEAGHPFRREGGHPFQGEGGHPAGA
jgi:hypothetical protein